MHPAVNVGVQLPVKAIDRLDHRPGFLGRSPAVEVNQRLAVDFAVQDRELLPYFFNVEHFSQGFDFRRGPFQDRPAQRLDAAAGHHVADESFDLQPPGLGFSPTAAGS